MATPWTAGLNWLKRSPALINALLSFGVAVPSGFWVNWLTSGLPLTWRAHGALALGVFCLLLQILYNWWVERLEKALVYDVLKMARCLLVEHALTAVRTEHLRLIVHFQGNAKPGKELARERCLIPHYELSPVSARDNGVIPLDNPAFKNWYINAQAFHQQDIVCAEPDATRRPPATKHFIDTPSLFRGKAVISIPIRSPDPPQVCIGTLTADSTFGLAELRWPRPGDDEPEVKEFLLRTADLIARIHTS